MSRPATAAATPRPLHLCIRPLRPADSPALRQACFPENDSADIDQVVKASLARARAGRGAHLVVEWDGALAASGQLVPWGRNAEIANLVVAPVFRRRGIGRVLLTALLDAARSLGYRMVEIGAEADNKAALSLYRQLGFVDRRTVRVHLDGAERTLIYLVRTP